MLRIIILSAILLVEANSGYTQKNAKLSELISSLDTAESESTFKELSDSFKNLSDTGVPAWVIQYYYALSNINRAKKIFSAKKKGFDKLFDTCIQNAKKAIDHITGLEIRHSEFLLLKYLFLQTEIVAVGYDHTTIISFGRETKLLLDEMEEMDPDNPKYYLLKAKNAIASKSKMNDSEESANKLLQKALDGFEKLYKSPDNLFKWGYHDALQFKKKYSSL